MDDPKVDKPKRDFLFLATGGVAAFGALALSKPLLGHMSPAADTSVFESLSVDVSKIDEGMQIRVLYRGHPLAIRHRTPAEIKSAQADDGADLRDPQIDQERLRPKPDGTFDPRFLVLNLACPHFGNIVFRGSGDLDGWACPSHGGKFDESGRVRSGAPVTNLEIPSYFWTSETSIVIRELTAFEIVGTKQL